MSETIRSYSSGGHVGFDSPSGGRRPIRKLLLAVICVALIWLYWSTRDTYPIERFVPQDQTFHVQARQLLASREKAANSPVWRLGLLPEKYKAVPEWLGKDFGLPDWVLNNLVSDVCYVSGKDLTGFSDLLVVTRMSRIGCLIERYHAFAGGMEDDFAGGLRLRRMGETDMYYAVRGRTLVFSPSRSALITALTLREDASVERIQDTIPDAPGDLQGQITLQEDEPLGQYMGSVDFALSFAPAAVHFTASGEVRAAWRASLDAISKGQTSSTVQVPEAGSVVLAGNFGVPLPEAWSAIDAMAGGALAEYAASIPLNGNTNGGGDNALAPLLDAMRGSLASSFFLRWTGFDVNGAAPLPELELFAETRGGTDQVLAQLAPPLVPGAVPSDTAIYRDPEGDIVHVPVGWGGVVEPAVQPVAGGIRAVLHPSHLADLPAEDGGTAQQGQLCLRLRPTEALQLLLEGGSIYAGAGFIRGETLDSFQATMAELVAGSRQVSEARLTADYRDGLLSLDLMVDLNDGE